MTPSLRQYSINLTNNVEIRNREYSNFPLIFVRSGRQTSPAGMEFWSLPHFADASSSHSSFLLEPYNLQLEFQLHCTSSSLSYRPIEYSWPIILSFIKGGRRRKNSDTYSFLEAGQFESPPQNLSFRRIRQHPSMASANASCPSSVAVSLLQYVRFICLTPWNFWVFSINFSLSELILVWTLFYCCAVDFAWSVAGIWVIDGLLVIRFFFFLFLLFLSGADVLLFLFCNLLPEVLNLLQRCSLHDS